MSTPLRALIFAHADDPVAARLARVSGAELVHRGRDLVGRTRASRFWDGGGPAPLAAATGWRPPGAGSDAHGAWLRNASPGNDGLAPDVVHVRLPTNLLDRAAAACTLAGVATCLCTPTDPAPPEVLPTLHRRWHRFVFGSQDEARSWRGLLPLGRLHVVGLSAGDAELAADLAAVWTESIRMAGR